jgi:hypothetical protein
MLEASRNHDAEGAGLKSFPDDFRFQLTAAETAASRSQSVILKSGRGQNIKFLPYAFTEHGAIMAATILNSTRAVQVWRHPKS